MMIPEISEKDGQKLPTYLSIAVVSSVLLVVLGWHLSIASQFAVFGDGVTLLFLVRNHEAGILSDYYVTGSGFWRPLIFHCYRLGNALWGLNPYYTIFGYFLHAVNVGLLWYFASSSRGLRLSPLAGGIAALIFCSNFATFEASILLPNAGDKLLLSFVLIGLMWRGGWGADLLITILCLLAKESGVIWPFLALIHDITLRGKRPGESFKHLLPSFLLAALFALWTYSRLAAVGGEISGGGAGDLSFRPEDFGRLFIDQIVAVWAFQVIKVEFNLLEHFTYYLSPASELPIVVDFYRVSIPFLVLILGFVCWRLRKHGLLLLMWLSLGFGIMSFRTEMVLSRYLYFPFAAMSLLVASSGSAILDYCARRKRSMHRVLVVFYAALLSIWLYMQCHAISTSPGIAHKIRSSQAAQLQALRLGPHLIEDEVPVWSRIILSECAFGSRAVDAGRMNIHLNTYYPGVMLRIWVKTAGEADYGPYEEGRPEFHYDWNRRSGDWERVEEIGAEKIPSK